MADFKAGWTTKKGGFLSHGGTSKSSINEWDFPWNKQQYLHDKGKLLYFHNPPAKLDMGEQYSVGEIVHRLSFASRTGGFPIRKSWIRGDFRYGYGSQGRTWEPKNWMVKDVGNTMA